MDIAIIGSGKIGGNLGLHWSRAGHRVLFASRHPEKLADTVNRARGDARAGTIGEAADFGEVFLIATPYMALPELAKQLRTATKGRVVIDAANTYPQRDGQMAQDVIDSELTASEQTARWFDEATVVKAFNTIYWNEFRDRAFPAPGQEALVVPYAADTLAGRETVEQLMEDVGFIPFYVGTLAGSGRLDTDGDLYATTKDFTVLDFEEALA